MQEELAQLQARLEEQQQALAGEQQARAEAQSEAQAASDELAQLRQRAEDDSQRLEELTSHLDAAQAARYCQCLTAFGLHDNMVSMHVKRSSVYM